MLLDSTMCARCEHIKKCYCPNVEQILCPGTDPITVEQLENALQPTHVHTIDISGRTFAPNIIMDINMTFPNLKYLNIELCACTDALIEQLKRGYDFHIAHDCMIQTTLDTDVQTSTDDQYLTTPYRSTSPETSPRTTVDITTAHKTDGKITTTHVSIKDEITTEQKRTITTYQKTDATSPTTVSIMEDINTASDQKSTSTIDQKTVAKITTTGSIMSDITTATDQKSTTTSDQETSSKIITTKSILGDITTEQKSTSKITVSSSSTLPMYTMPAENTYMEFNTSLANVTILTTKTFQSTAKPGVIRKELISTIVPIAVFVVLLINSVLIYVYRKRILCKKRANIDDLEMIQVNTPGIMMRMSPPASRALGDSCHNSGDTEDSDESVVIFERPPTSAYTESLAAGTSSDYVVTVDRPQTRAYTKKMSADTTSV